MTQIRQLWIEPISYGIGNEVLGSAQILVASAAACGWSSSSRTTQAAFLAHASSQAKAPKDPKEPTLGTSKASSSSAELPEEDVPRRRIMSSKAKMPTTRKQRRGGSKRSRRSGVEEYAATSREQLLRTLKTRATPFSRAASLASMGSEVTDAQPRQSKRFPGCKAANPSTSPAKTSLNVPDGVDKLNPRNCTPRWAGNASTASCSCVSRGSTSSSAGRKGACEHSATKLSDSFARSLAEPGLAPRTRRRAIADAMDWHCPSAYRRRANSFAASRLASAAATDSPALVNAALQAFKSSAALV
mmetsp:Transcript_20962/g.49829  ORF Transcript_20962/g.49829 Transcript_20962/m.49829 type:complete len:302 (+) Transcript_20962:16-921(+)